MWEVEDLKSQRAECHEKLGAVKNTRSFVIQAVTFWDEVVALTKTATVKTERIKRIVELAAKKNTLKLLTCNGTQMQMKSFKESWMEVAETISSDGNNLVFTKEVVPHLIQLVFLTALICSRFF